MEAITMVLICQAIIISLMLLMIYRLFFGYRKADPHPPWLAPERPKGKPHVPKAIDDATAFAMEQERLGRNSKPFM